MTPGTDMTPLADMEDRFDALGREAERPTAAVGELLRLGEQTLEHWLIAHRQSPTGGRKEGFRLLALHRQAAKGDPAFNACRETCRELVYHYNLIRLDPDHSEIAVRVRLASMVAKHLYLFITGKLQEAGLGEFCCSSRPLRAEAG